MTDRKPLRTTLIINFAMSRDGTKYAFQVVTKQRITFDLETEAEEIWTLVRDLVTHAAAMRCQRIFDGFECNESAISYSPITTEGFGMAAGESPEMTLLVARLYTFELAFETPDKQLDGLADSIRCTAILMSSDPAKPH